MGRPDIVAPRGVSDAIAALAATPGARPIAGGTDILVQRRHGAQSPPLLVALHAIPELRAIAVEGDLLRLGACVTLATLVTAQEVRRLAPLLSEVAGMMASAAVRTRATVAGNLCNASPAADLAPALLVHEATVVLAGPGGTRSIALAQFLLGPGATQRRDSEIMTEILVPGLGTRSGAAFEKHQATACGDLSVVSVAATVRLNGPGKTCREARIALGAVAPTAIRAPAAEEAVRGTRLSDSDVERAGTLALDACCPIDDVRATSVYRREVTGVLVARALGRAAARARG